MRADGMLHFVSRYLVMPSTTFGFDANPIDFSSTSAVGSLVPSRDGEKMMGSVLVEYY